MRLAVASSGERVGVESELGWVSDLLCEEAGTQVLSPEPDGIRVRVMPGHSSLATDGWDLLAPDVWRREGEVAIHNAWDSGFDLRVNVSDDVPTFCFRWRPDLHGAGRVLRARRPGAVAPLMLHFPAMWWAAASGRAPLGACAVDLDGATVLVARAAAGVGGAVADDRPDVSAAVSVTDGMRVWSVAGGASGAVEPQCIVVFRRRGDGGVRVRRVDEHRAERELVAGTFMAPELQRYWALASTLSLATGIGPVHPQVARVAGILARCLPCTEVAFSDAVGAGALPALVAALPEATLRLAGAGR